MNAQPPRLSYTILRPAELLFCHEPMIVSSLLGSSLAVTFFDPVTRESAICHPILPSFTDKKHHDHPEQENPGKYVDLAIPKVLSVFREKGVELKRLQIKIFGGMEALSPRQIVIKSLCTGQRNSREALKIFLSNGLLPENQDVGGSDGRKIWFLTYSGEVFIVRIAGSENGTAQEQPLGFFAGK